MLRHTLVAAALTLVLSRDVPHVAPISAKALHRLTVPGYADFVALEGDDAWVTNEGRVEKLTAGITTPVASVSIAEPCGAMAVDFGALWVADCTNGTLVRVGLRTHTIEATIPTGLADPSGEPSLATVAGSVWLLADSSGVLSRVVRAQRR